jgi:hypothetical protein
MLSRAAVWQLGHPRPILAWTGCPQHGRSIGKAAMVACKDHWYRHPANNPLQYPRIAPQSRNYRSSTKWLMEWFSWLGYYSNCVQAKEVWFRDMK